MAKQKNAQVYEAAKLRFKREYEQENPKPQKPSHKNFWLDFQVLYTLFIALASFLLSALRTYKVFEHVGSGVEGVLGVIVVEGVALGIPFFLVLRHYKEHDSDKPYTPGQLRGWMYILVFFSVGIGLGANIYEAVGADAWVPDSINYGFLVFVGAIATVTVATLGHILGVLWVQNLVDYTYYLAVYENDLTEWTENMNERWKYDQRKWYKMTEALADGRGIATHPVDGLERSSAVGFARMAHSSPVHHEQPKLNTTEQVAGILSRIHNLDDWTYSQLLARDDIGSLTKSKGTLSNAKRLLDSEWSAD